MKKNIGVLDKIIRFSVAVIITVLYFTNVITGTLGIVLLVAAGMFIFTGFVGFCPFYFPFRISTRRSDK